jgi:integrase
MGKEGRQTQGERQEGETVIYKRGCNRKGPNGKCSKCGDRGACGVYWYKFMWQGKLLRESTKQCNDKIARQMEAAHRTSLAKGEVGIRDKKPSPTLAEFIETRFEPWAKSTFEKSSPKTWFDYYRVGLRNIQAYKPLATAKLDEIGGEAIGCFALHRQAKGLQVSSVNSSLQVLRRVLRIAVEWGALNAAPSVRMLSGARSRERVVDALEEAKYLAASPELLAAVAAVLLDTGMRPEECFRLRWESINWFNGRHGTLLVTHGKTAAARRVLPMTPRVRKILETRWKNVGNLAEGWAWSASTRSGHLEGSSLKKQHANALKASGVRSFVLYSLRHTFLTRLGESGCDAWTLARIAGHSSIAMSTRYVHPSENAVLNAMSRLGGHNSGHIDKCVELTESEKPQLAN